jgi:hypothetical protein
MKISAHIVYLDINLYYVKVTYVYALSTSMHLKLIKYIHMYVLHLVLPMSLILIKNVKYD